MGSFTICAVVGVVNNVPKDAKTRTTAGKHDADIRSPRSMRAGRRRRATMKGEVGAGTARRRCVGWRLAAIERLTGCLVSAGSVVELPTGGV